MKHTLPALIFCLFKLSAQIESGMGAALPEAVEGDEDAPQLVKVDQMKIFKAVNELILALQEQQQVLCMKLYL